MPTYPVINKESGEKKELSMTMKAYDEWKEANPDWDRDWQAGVAGVGEIGEVYDKLKKSHPGWNDVLYKASKAPRSRVKPL
jgi:hypothetical protein